MRFRSKIWLAMVTAAVLPLLLLGWLSDRTNREQIGVVVGRLQTQHALELARGCERFVSNAVANLRLAVSYIPFDSLSHEELAAVLAIPYRQLPFVNIVALLDATGNAIVPPLFEARPQDHAELAGHEPVGEPELQAFAGRVPLAAALAAGSAVGPPYRTARGARVAVAVRIDGEPARVLAAELSLTELQARATALAADGRAAFIADGQGRLIVHGDGAATALGADEARLVADGLASGGTEVREIGRGPARFLAALAPVRSLGWAIVVAEPAAVAFRAAERVRLYTLLWAALALASALALGALLARSLNRPIAALSAVARQATEGNYAAAAIESRDELGQFGRAFNHMIAEVRRRDDEIRRWNEELQRRVDERTAALREAQDQILRTRRLAALGSLGAGIAHELNNPLTSVIGMTTLARRELPPEHPAIAALDTVIDQARRAARIAQDLRQFADRERENAGKRFNARKTLEAALEETREHLASNRIDVKTAIAEGLPELQGDPVQIQLLVVHLLRNAVTAMPGGGRLEVGAQTIDRDAVRLWVSDTGKGIAPELRERIFDPFFSTKDDPSQLGMGLAICHSIATAHHGKISVDSEVEKGSTFSVLLPAAAPDGHLY